MKGIGQLASFILMWALLILFSFGIALIPFVMLLCFTHIGAGRREIRSGDILADTLMPNEEVLAAGVQHRVFALWQRRTLLAITTSRLVTISRGIFGGFQMKDIQWKDLEDARIERNVLSSLCGSNLRFKHFNQDVEQFVINGIANKTASTIYSRAQFEEQAWEEKRRVRSMEEVRAASGGVVVHTGQPHSAAPNSNRMLDEIERAKKMLDMGAVSDAEFREMKAKILGAA